MFLPDGHPPAAGDRLVLADLGDTLARLASHGPDFLYRGPLGERIASYLQARGGGLSAADFVRVMSVQRVTRAGLAGLRPAIVPLANAEGLTAHAESIEVRVRGGA